MNNSIENILVNYESKENVLSEERKNGAFKYLIDKYSDDVFLAKSYTRSNWAYSYDVVVFHSSYYNANFSVYIVEKDSNILYYDDYYTLYMKDEAENYYYEMCKDLFSGDFAVKVRFNDVIIGDSTGEMAFEDYISTQHSGIDVCYIISTDTDLACHEDIINRFVEKKYPEVLSFYKADSIDAIKLMSYSDVVNCNKGITVIATYTIFNDLSVKRYK